MLLNKEWVNNKMGEEIKNFTETNENELTATQNSWDIVKPLVREKFIAIHAYLKKIEIFLFFFNCYSITVVCLFSPSLHPTPGEPTSLPPLHPPP